MTDDSVIVGHFNPDARFLDIGWFDQRRVKCLRTGRIKGNKTWQQGLIACRHAACRARPPGRTSGIIDGDGCGAGRNVNRNELADRAATNAVFKSEGQRHAPAYEAVHLLSDALAAPGHAIMLYLQGSINHVRV